MKKLLVILTVGLLSGCGGGMKTIVQSPTLGAKRTTINTAVLISQSDNDTKEIDDHIKMALATNNVRLVQIIPPKSTRTITTKDIIKHPETFRAPAPPFIDLGLNLADVIIARDEYWYWDLSTYLMAVSVGFYDGSTGNLLIDAKWDQLRKLHGYQRGATVEGLINESIAELRK